MFSPPFGFLLPPLTGTQPVWQGVMETSSTKPKVGWAGLGLSQTAQHSGVVPVPGVTVIALCQLSARVS